MSNNFRWCFSLRASLSFLSQRTISFSRYRARELFAAILVSFASGSGCFLPLCGSLLWCGSDWLLCALLSLSAYDKLQLLSCAWAFLSHSRELCFGKWLFLLLCGSLLLCGLDCLLCDVVFSSCWWARWDRASMTPSEFEKGQCVSSIFASYLYILLLVICWLSSCREECGVE